MHILNWNESNELIFARTKSDCSVPITAFEKLTEAQKKNKVRQICFNFFFFSSRNHTLVTVSSFVYAIYAERLAKKHGEMKRMHTFEVCVCLCLCLYYAIENKNEIKSDYRVYN